MVKMTFFISVKYHIQELNSGNSGNTHCNVLLVFVRELMLECPFPVNLTLKLLRKHCMILFSNTCIIGKIDLFDK